MSTIEKSSRREMSLYLATFLFSGCTLAERSPIQISLFEDKDGIHPETGLFTYSFNSKTSSTRWVEQAQEKGFRMSLVLMTEESSRMIISNNIGLSDQPRPLLSWITLMNFQPNKSYRYQIGWERWSIVQNLCLLNGKPIQITYKQT